VWHLSDNAANTTVVDSSSNATGGTAAANTSGKTTTGQVGAALTFNGSSDAINLGIASSLGLGDVLTIEAWVKATSLSARQGIFTTRNQNESGSFQLEVGPGNSHTNVAVVAGVGTWVAETTNNVVATSQWKHLVYTRTSSTSQTIYVNGAAQSLQGSATYSFSDNSSTKYIGEGTNGGQFFGGSLDEVRISKIARSADWIATEYNNQNSPSTFYSVGTETSP
jgi:hypothetical protein